MNNICLRKLSSDREIRSLYRMMSGDEQYLYSVNFQHKSESLFARWIRDRMRFDFHDFFIIYCKESDEPVGFVHSYDFSLADGHCKTVVYVEKNYRQTGTGGFAAIFFLKELFTMYPLKKVYSTVYEYNEQSLKSNLKAGFIIEGKLRDYRYHSGDYHDMYYLSISRDDFFEKFGRFE